ncbi:hypothetical protein Avbf_04797, partial [Armadillidium vulgare]
LLLLLLLLLLRAYMKMKIVLLFAALALFVKAQDSPDVASDVALDGDAEKPTPMVRDLPADVLRDFIGFCFASTLCRVFEVGQTWELTPFCGRASCVLSPEGYLIERVNDCGVLPKPNPKCRIINEDARNETYPNCCPIFQCEKGIKLEYPTKEELQATLNTPSKIQTSASAVAQ